MMVVSFAKYTSFLIINTIMIKKKKSRKVQNLEHTEGVNASAGNGRVFTGVASAYLKAESVQVWIETLAKALIS